jgi:translation initiation factor 2B subunit (eIF-2B alpha/beta/delta family)
VVLVHSMSRPLLRLLLLAAERNKRFTVLVTEARPTLSGCVHIQP